MKGSEENETCKKSNSEMVQGSQKSTDRQRHGYPRSFGKYRLYKGTRISRYKRQGYKP